jgi:hypothetical protein
VLVTKQAVLVTKQAVLVTKQAVLVTKQGVLVTKEVVMSKDRRFSMDRFIPAKLSCGKRKNATSALIPAYDSRGANVNFPASETG